MSLQQRQYIEAPLSNVQPAQNSTIIDLENVYFFLENVDSQKLLK